MATTPGMALALAVSTVLRLRLNRRRAQNGAKFHPWQLGIVAINRLARYFGRDVYAGLWLAHQLQITNRFQRRRFFRDFPFACFVGDNFAKGDDCRAIGGKAIVFYLQAVCRTTRLQRRFLPQHLGQGRRRLAQRGKRGGDGGAAAGSAAVFRPNRGGSLPHSNRVPGKSQFVNGNLFDGRVDALSHLYFADVEA